MSVDPTDPSELFGGTWERIEGRFLLGASSTYAASSTGGEEKHTLTEAELPSLEGFANFRGWTWGGGSEGVNVLSAGGIMSSTTIDSTYDQLQYGNGQGDYSNLRIAFGSDQPHNNMPPYLAVYIWVRTA